MAENTTITATPTNGPPTVSKAQINAIRSGIRAAASSNPQGVEHGARCIEITRSVCADFGAGSLSGIRADCFPAVMRAVAEMAVPKRRQGPIEFRLRACKTALDDTVASILQARRDVAAFRREAEATLMEPLKDALEVEGKGNLEAVVQDGLGYMIAAPLLDIEHELDRIQSLLQVLSTRLPAIGRALDERRPVPAMFGAD